MKREALIGFLLILLGAGLFVYYDSFVRPEKEAEQLLDEGKMVFERGSKKAVSDSINILSKVIARYPETKSTVEAYYYIGMGYEKLGLNRLAYLKYLYILKTGNHMPQAFQSEIRTRIAGLTIKQSRSEEGINQLLGILNYTSDNIMKSRIYTELGHTYLSMGSLKKAKRMFDIALSEKGDNEEAVIGKARTFKRMGFDNKAYDHYEYFLKYFGNFSHYSSDIRKAYLSQLYRSGYDSFRKARYYRSIDFFKRLLRFFKGNSKTENAYYWIGECYYSLNKYETAISYFDRALANSFTHKDQDARMKKGYTFFMSKRFDLAAREFQKYMKDYPNGKHYKTARNWKKMSTKEIMYRIKNKMLPDTDEADDESDFNEKTDDSESAMESKSDGSRHGNARAVSSDASVSDIDYRIKQENVAEL